MIIEKYRNYIVNDIRVLADTTVAESLDIYVKDTVCVRYDSSDVLQYYLNKVKRIHLTKVSSRCRVYLYDENNHTIGGMIVYNDSKLSFISFTVESIVPASGEVTELDGLNGISGFTENNKIQVVNHGALINDQDLSYATVDSEITYFRDDGLRDIKITSKEGFNFDERRMKAYIKLSDLGFDTDQKINLPNEWFLVREDKIIFRVLANFIISAGTPITLIYLDIFFRALRPSTGKVYDCFIDNKEISVRDGFTINDEMNEKLDSGTLQFIHDGGEAPIDPFDTVIFESNPELHTTRKKLLIDVFDSEIENFKDSLDNSDYFYTLNIFSESKMLERITCPNLTITKRPDGTVVTVWDKIKQYCRMYLPRIFVYDETSPFKKKMKCCLKYDRALEQKFSMECPEMSWQEPTLKEVLSDLFYVADCIPVVKENVLTFFDLNYRGKEIDQSKLTNRTHRASSADYCDELTIPMKNVISKTSIHKEYVTARAIDSGEMTTDNMVIVTQKPIYRILNFWVYAGGDVDVGYPAHREPKLLVVNLMRAGGGSSSRPNFIVEEEEYKVLNPRTKNIPSGANPAGYQCFVLSYKRGSNIISNIGQSIKYNTELTTSHTDARISNAFGACRALIEGGGASNVAYYAIKDTNTRKIFFEIEYESIDESTLHVGKLSQIKNPNNKLFDGQTAQTVDIEKQTIHEYAKANRLGNKIITIYGEYFDEREIPQLGDTIGDKVLFSRSITYWDGQLNFKGELIDNYILRDYFTGVLSKRRSWAIASEQDSVIRHDVVKFYVTASLKHQKATLLQYDIPYSLTGDYGHVVDVFSGFVATQYMVNGVVTRSQGKEGFVPSANDYIIMETNINVVGRSFVCDFGFIDNALAGYTIDRDDDGDFNAHIVSYCDSNGEVRNNFITLCNIIEPAEDDEEGGIDFMINWMKDTEHWDSDEGQRIWDKINYYNNRKPLTVLHAFETYEGHMQRRVLRINRNYMFKDNRETMKTSVQFEFTSDNEKIIVYDKLAQYCNFIFSSAEVNLKLYQLVNDRYRPTEKIARGTLKTNWGLTVTNYDESGSTGENAYQKVTLTGTSGLSANDSWCVADENDNILLAVNGNEQNIIFEIRLFRDNNVYNSQIDKIKIGTSDQVDELDTAYEENPPEIFSIKSLGREVSIDDFKDFEGADD